MQFDAAVPNVIFARGGMPLSLAWPNTYSNLILLYPVNVPIVLDSLKFFLFSQFSFLFASAAERSRKSAWTHLKWKIRYNSTVSVCTLLAGVHRTTVCGAVQSSHSASCSTAGCATPSGLDCACFWRRFRDVSQSSSTRVYSRTFI